MTTGDYCLSNAQVQMDPALAAQPGNAQAAAASPAPKLGLTIVDTVDKLEGLKTTWNELYAASPAAAPPLSWRWVREWWRIYGPIYGDKGRGLRILALHQGEALVGLLPLYEGYKNAGVVKMRRLTCLTDGASEFEETCADYLGLLHAPGMEAQCVEAITQELSASSRLGWDEFCLPNLRSTSALATLETSFQRRGFRTVTQRLNGSYLCDLTDGFDAYLQRLSARNRKQARAVLRDVDNAGLTFEPARDAAQACAFFDQMVELHRKRWTARGQAGSFSPRHAEFHRAVLAAGAASGDTFIGRLAQDGVPISVFYGHRAGRNFHCYQQGTDTTAITKVRSPGIAAALMSIRHAASTGVTLFDFEQGVNPFKERFCTGTCPLVEVRVTRLNLRSLGYQCAELCRRGARKLLHKNRKPVPDRPDDKSE